jgi:hypothetical protein
MSIVLNGYVYYTGSTGDWWIRGVVTEFANLPDQTIQIYVRGDNSGLIAAKFASGTSFFSQSRKADLTDIDWDQKFYLDIYQVISGYRALLDSRVVNNAVRQTGVNYSWEEIPQTTPLSTPTGLYADNITSDSAKVSWTAVENASGYKVEYRRQGDTTWNE